MGTVEKTEYYRTAMQTTLADLAESLEEREGLEDRLEEVISRISSLRETAYSLSGLCDINPRKENPHLFQEDISPDVGFTDAVRGVFEPSLMLTPVMVRDTLKERGFKLEGYKNPLASIHTILKRLKKAGELMVWDEAEQPTMYHLPPVDEPVAASSQGSAPGQKRLKPLGKSVAVRLKKKDPKWFKHMKETAKKKDE